MRMADNVIEDDLQLPPTQAEKPTGSAHDLPTSPLSIFTVSTLQFLKG